MKPRKDPHMPFGKDNNGNMHRVERKPRGDAVNILNIFYPRPCVPACLFVIGTCMGNNFTVITVPIQCRRKSRKNRGGETGLGL